MSESKHYSAGGKARAIIEKQEAKQRIDEYNKNPNLCKLCNKPIIAPYDKRLYDTKIKKFCSRSCVSKFNNIKNSKNTNRYNNIPKIIDNFTDEEINEIYINSKNITDFSFKLGFKSRISSKYLPVENRLKKLGLSINNLKKEKNDIMNTSKIDLFNKCTNWQAARSTIQSHARKIYEVSNKPKKCIVCGYDRHYEVAHIKAVSDFNDNVLISEINDIDNLIALCPNHHWEYDNTDFDITPYLNEVI